MPAKGGNTEQAPRRPAFDQSGLQQPQTQARNVPDQSRLRLPDGRRRGPAENQLAEYGRAREARRRDGVRGAGAGGALARLRRQAQSARARASRPTPGHRASPPRPKRAGVVATSHCSINHPLVAAKQGDSHRPYFRRPLHPQYRHRLEQAGDRHVRRRDAAARRALRHGRGMARHRQAAVDRGRRVRPRGQVLQDRERLSAAEADSAALPGDHECRRLGARPSLRRQILRPRFHRAWLAGFRKEQGADRRLPQAGARGIRARDRDLVVGEYHSGRNRSRGAPFRRLHRQREGRLGSGVVRARRPWESTPRPFRPRRWNISRSFSLPAGAAIR